MRVPRVRFTIRRIMIVVAIISLVLAAVAWSIRAIDSINQGLHEFYRPGGKLERIHRGETE